MKDDVSEKQKQGAIASLRAGEQQKKRASGLVGVTAA